ncbi:uncharacterized protein LOC6558714 [Drosophila grimshawi]|uniref:GH15281 n=1 Tax=Drosophila grimshawi TaxID=7222 RepID=B4IWZ4_DROGR|nr:uncharacterized protein LOC6558714 [Drosophila grimshawi]EDV96300.1 GH15281 [Drosophila grimshawi]
MKAINRSLTKLHKLRMYPYRGVLFFACITAQGFGLNLQIHEFYSKSFVPNEILISYNVENMEVLTYNLTVKEHFPGKLLMHVFVRRLDDVPGGSHTYDLIKFKNLDFCKTLDSLRNMTIDDVQGESLLPSTFLMSCPLMPGFYYVDKTYITENALPLNIVDGRYLAQFELIQVYEEVTRLMNCKLKLTKKSFDTEMQIQIGIEEHKAS